MRILELSITALEVATAGFPIPGLGIILESGLRIAKKAKEIEDTRDDCRALAERATTLVLAVHQQLQNDSGGAGGKEHVMTFLHNLLEIENLMDRRLRAGRLERMLFAFKRGKIAEEVETLTTKLENFYRIFMVQASLAVDQSVNTLTSGNICILQHIDDSARVGEAVLGDTAEIRNGLSDLVHRAAASATFDGNFRLFARENLTLLEPVIDPGKPRHGTDTHHRGAHTLVQATIQPRSGRVLRYRAIVEAAGKLTGTQVVVYAYPNHDDQRFVASVKWAKQTCHPHVLAMLGYSRPGDPGEAAYIVTEDYIPFSHYIRSFRGTSRLRALLRMNTAICMAADHLGVMELHELLPTDTSWDSSASHHVGIDEIVFDHRHGGRFKWARPALVIEETHTRKVLRMDAPIVQASRMRILEEDRAVACARVDTVMQHWLLQILHPVARLYDDYYCHAAGRTWWPYWEQIVHHPQFQPGMWLGRNSCHEDWTCLSARKPPGSELATTVQRKPLVFPRQDGLSFRKSDKSDLEWLKLPEPDLNDMCIDFELGVGRDRTRWKRYRFSCIPINTTLLFQQRIHMPESLDAGSWMMHLLPDSTILGRYLHIGIATHRKYYTETTITMSAHATQQADRRFWFFLLQFNGGDNAHDRNIPSGFWSSEKYPTSVPADDIFDPTPQFEPVGGNIEAPLFTSTQVLGDLVFTTQTKMETEIVQLTEDELLAFEELQESHPSIGEMDVWHSNDCGTA